MRSTIQGAPSFSHIHIDLSPGETVTVESGAMQSMAAELDMKAVTNGGFFAALAKSIFGGESFFVSRFTNNENRTLRVTVAQDVPGELVELQLSEGQEICLQKGAFLGSTGNVNFTTSWAGFASWMTGEGLIRLKASGPGTLWFGAYGGINQRQVNGDLKVDDGHLVAYEPGFRIKLAFPGGFFTSMFGGEGVVTQMIGTGTVYLQTRSVKGLAAWLNPKFR